MSGRATAPARGPDTGPQPVGQSLDAVLGRMGASPSPH